MTLPTRTTPPPPATTPCAVPPLGALRDRLGAAQVLLAGDVGFADAVAPWNVAARLRPRAVVRARDARDVASTLDWSRRHGAPVFALSTGHGAASAPPLDDAVLLRLDALDDVRVEPSARVVHVGPGASWRAVVTAAEPTGAAALAGTGPSVGAVGSTLGGGIGWLGRRFGLASESLVAAELVLPDGTLVEVDERREPELLWALRGGRSALGVVTRATLRLHPVPELTAGTLMWPLERAPDVLGRWAAWTASVPEAVTSVARLLRFPPSPEVPEPLRARAMASIELAVTGPLGEAEALVAPLRDLRPELDLLAPARPTSLLALAGDPETPTPAVADHLLLRELPASAVAALIATAGSGGAAAPAFVAIRHLGGALARPGAGALGSLPAPYVAVVLSVPAPGAQAAAQHDVDLVVDALRPWAHERAYLNFAERPTHPTAAFGAAAARRLTVLKRRLDPGGLLLSDLRPEPA